MRQRKSESETRNNQPLRGIRVMTTRPRQATSLDYTLRGLGAETLFYPTISIEPADDPAGWAAFRNANPDNCWLIFTSENGVTHFWDKIDIQANLFPPPHIFKTAVIGTGTARALRERKATATFISKGTTAAALADEMLKSYELNDVFIIRVRGNLANDIIERRLSDAGAIVRTLTAYNTNYYLWPKEMKQYLLQNPPDAVIFASSSAVEGFHHNLDEKDASILTNKAKFFSLGISASEALHKHGWTIAGQAQEPTTEDLIDVMLNYYRKEKS